VQARETQRTKSTGWDSDEDLADDQAVSPSAQDTAALEPLQPGVNEDDELEENQSLDPIDQLAIDEEEGEKDEEDTDQCEQDEKLWDDD
jgi:hypothetical protein